MSFKDLHGVIRPNNRVIVTYSSREVVTFTVVPFDIGVDQCVDSRVPGTLRRV